MAGVGDVNGDGFDDFMIGAPCDEGRPKLGVTTDRVGAAAGLAVGAGAVLASRLGKVELKPEEDKASSGTEG